MGKKEIKEVQEFFTFLINVREMLENAELKKSEKGLEYMIMSDTNRKQIIKELDKGFDLIKGLHKKKKKSKIISLIGDIRK